MDDEVLFRILIPKFGSFYKMKQREFTSMQSNNIETQSYSGLSSLEIPALRKKYGLNEIASKKERNFLERLIGVVMEPMIFLLIFIGIIYQFIGDTSEALLLSASVILIIIITIYQEGKTESAISALKTMASPRTNVIRDGQIRKVDGKDLVPGDIIIVNEGDRIPADIEIKNTEHLMMDESLLTGESIPILKHNSDSVYCGSLVTAGQAICEVKLTGNLTRIGKIGKTISEEKIEKSLLEKDVQILVRWIFIFAVIVCVALVLYLGFTTGKWTLGLLSGLTLAIGILPEELPLVLTIFFAFGAYRLSKKNVLTRKTSIIETLGAATVLCTDKTGTITQNKMKIQCFVDTNLRVNKLEDFNFESQPKIFPFLLFGMLASKRHAFDPMDKAFFDLWQKFKNSQIYDLESYQLILEFPIAGNFLAFTQVWKSGSEYIVATKGAPETIIKLCNLDKNSEEKILNKTSEMAKLGYRMLAVAKSSERLSTIPDSPREPSFEFLGLVGLEDPIREEVPEAIRNAYLAGIRVIMITGDYPETAKSIARQIGLEKSEFAITGETLAKLKEEEYKQAVLQNNIFSRVSPEEKWRLVGVLKDMGEVVAMTGDGVNDAPALKRAHIGVAMGGRGTDVAREASSLVLLDDSFSSLIRAVEEGRHIYSNLRKALGYIIAVHIPIIGATFFPILFNLPNVILSAVHIVFLEMIIDPTCTLVFEKEPIEEGTMKTKPRNMNQSLLDLSLFTTSIIQGLFSLFAVIASYVFIVYYDKSSSQDSYLANTAAFVTLIFSNLLLILVNRNKSKLIIESIRVRNDALPYVAIGTLLILFAALYIPALQSLFHFSPLSGSQVFVCFLISIISIVWFEIGKLFIRKKH